MQSPLFQKMNMKENKLMIAAAGAGKTTYIVNMAFDLIKENKKATILLLTFTRSNSNQIREKIATENYERNGIKAIPYNITVSEWFKFLLKDGVRPFKSIMHPRLKYKSIGLYHDFQYNNNIYINESEIIKHYFLKYKIIPNVISKFVIKANDKTENSVINRINSIYSHIFIDEVQDLVGYDLEIIKKLFSTNSSVILVGDPRQVTYITHFERLNSHYRDGKIKEYIKEKCNKLNVVIDETTLKKSHRNNNLICEFASRLYPNLEKSEKCDCDDCQTDINLQGIYIIRTKDVDSYKSECDHLDFCVLRSQKSVFPERNFGDSKGLTFDHVLVYPTGTIINYLKTGSLIKMVRNKKGVMEEKDAFDIAKFYVAVTRARNSVAIVYDFDDDETFIEGIIKYKPEK